MLAGNDENMILNKFCGDKKYFKTFFRPLVLRQEIDGLQARHLQLASC